MKKVNALLLVILLCLTGCCKKSTSIPEPRLDIEERQQSIYSIENMIGSAEYERSNINLIEELIYYIDNMPKSNENVSEIYKIYKVTPMNFWKDTNSINASFNENGYQGNNLKTLKFSDYSENQITDIIYFCKFNDDNTIQTVLELSFTIYVNSGDIANAIKESLDSYFNTYDNRWEKGYNNGAYTKKYNGKFLEYSSYVSFLFNDSIDWRLQEGQGKGKIGVKFTFTPILETTQNQNEVDYFAIIVIGSVCILTLVFIIFEIVKSIRHSQYIKEQVRLQQVYQELTNKFFSAIGYSSYKNLEYDFVVHCKSSRAVDNYTDVNFFKENPDKLSTCLDVIQDKKNYLNSMRCFLSENDLENEELYEELVKDITRYIENNKNNVQDYSVLVSYVSSTGRSSNENILHISVPRIKQFQTDKSLLMTKSEYNAYVKEQENTKLEEKRNTFYNRINSMIDAANKWQDHLAIDEDESIIDTIIRKVLEQVPLIQKIKRVDGEEWTVIENTILPNERKLVGVFSRNKQIFDYYKSPDFAQIKNACSTLMNTQRDFNEYIAEKANSIASMFGTKLVREETVSDDVYNYVRPYKKTVTPFTAHCSSRDTFSRWENDPMSAIIKNFYPDKSKYKEQIQQLHTLIEELETLKEAKQIIENYKKEYQQYIQNVPSYILQYDEDGFYERLGFANIKESILTVEYKLVYTSDGGFKQDSFTVRMTEENVIALIKELESKLSMSSFSTEQRRLMTAKLRQHIKERDNFTCKYCGNSIYKEPNLLLEVDHIIPIAKGGYTEESNLQTLCWKCNRSKSAKLI